MSKIKLGINLDHVATLRQARGGEAPSLYEAVRAAERGGADGVTVHLREDRRHIQDRDVWMVKQDSKLPLNLEMSLAPEIVAFALRVKPPKVCLVPEKRRELTTEGGLDVVREARRLLKVIPMLQDKGIEVSLFVEPSLRQLEASQKTGADFVELHTGSYANQKGGSKKRELIRLREGSRAAQTLGLGVNAGHGLDLENVGPVCRMLPYLVELNIGHSVISRAIFVGLEKAVREMKQAICGKRS
jgi:pyridoxine 5-phosphate synthase